MVAVTGLGSGIDIESLVSGLVDAERVPAEQQFLRRETAVTNVISGIGSLKSALADLQGGLAQVSDLETYSKFSASSSNSSAVSVSTSGTAALGAFDVEVSALAKTQTLTSGAFVDAETAIGSGTLTLTLGTPTYAADPEVDPDTTYTGFVANPEKTPVVITLDGTNNTLEGIRDAINEADAGVTAVIITDDAGARLSLSTEDTGSINSVAVSVTGDVGLSALAYDATTSGLTQGRAASDASYSINGSPLTSVSNTVEGTVDGINLTLKDVTTSPATILVSENRGAITSAVQSFIDGFNKYADVVGQLTDYNQETNTRGQLQGDFSARGVIRSIQGQLNQASGFSSAFNSLAAIGITTGADGKLSLDSAELNAALDADSSAVQAVFADTTYNGTPVTGVAARLDSVIDDLLASDGFLKAREDGLSERIDSISEDREALNFRLENLEARYRQQFNAMDALLSNITSTGDFLQQQLANLPGYYSGNDK